MAQGDAGNATCAETACAVVGDFEIRFSQEGLGQILVEHSDDVGRVLWSTPEGTSAVTAGWSDAAIGYSRGSFTFDTSQNETCLQSQIISMEQGDGEVIATGAFQDCALGFTMRFSALTEERLRVEVALSDGDQALTFNRLTVRWTSDEDEALLGFGAQYSFLDMKGRLLPIWCEEQGHGRGLEPITEIINTGSPGSAGDWYTSYTAVPYFLSNRNYGFLVENSEYLEFDFREPTVSHMTVFSGAMAAQIVYGQSPMDVVKGYTQYSGRMDPLPEWTQNGAIVRSYGGSEEAYSRLDELKEVGAALAAFWVEDWAGTRITAFGTRMWWNWQIDRTVYPDFEEMVGALNEEGIKVLIYFNPFLVDAAEKPGVERNLYSEASEQGLLVKDGEGEVVLIGSGGFDAGLLDLTNPATKVWIKDVMSEVLATGVSGWMADFGEALPIDIALHSQEDPARYHNLYPYEWAKLNQEVAKEAGVYDDFLTFSRSGNALSPSVARMFWIGDQLVTWDEFDGLRTVIPALMSSGLSGYSLQHADTGGWLSISVGDLKVVRSKELFQRWLDLNTFTVSIRLHTTNLPEKNHQYDSDQETLEHFARMTRVFSLLKDYRVSLMNEAKELGYPVVRHPLLHFPGDPEAWKLTQQFMLGSQFMVAPVVEEGGTAVELYLPAGRWVHVWTGELHGDEAKGVTITIDSPIGKPAVFYPEGSVEGDAFAQALEEQGLL